MLNFAPVKELCLRPYQLDSVDGLRAGIREGKKRQILVAPTGAGKTVIASHLLREADRKGSYALFLVDRVALVDQTSKTLDEYGIRHGVIQGGHPRWAPRENVQVCSIQTLARRSLPRNPSLFIYDEAHCFVAGTLVATPAGPRKIEEIEEGDAVFNAVGIGYVRHSFYHDDDDLVRVSFDDGTEIECTADHRFFTGDSWVQARFLDGHCAFGIEAMPDLWEHLSSADYADCPWELVGGSKEVLDEKEVLLAELCKEIEEPNAQPNGAQEDGGNIAQNKAYADADRWVRARSDRAAASVIAGAWRRLAARTDGKDRCEAGQWNTEPLEDRHSKSAADDCDRSGRRQPQRSECPREGSAQGPIPSVKRVVSVQGIECKGGRSVYNLHVSGHPSFFANGVLVHNCVYKSATDFMARHPEAVGVGLTATPFTPGLSDHWAGVVNVTTTRTLINDGFLVEPKIYVARSPEDAELGLNSFGEFSDRSAEAAGIRIVGDVVKEWITKTTEHFGGPVKTIVFSPSVDHGREVCAAFSAAGFNFQQISYLDKDDDERRLKIEEFRRPDSMIHGLVSCGVLTKGFDVADVRCGISCKPYRKSLSSHLQEIGRIMRPIMGEDKKAIWLCLARDSEILTDRGLVRIQFVTKHDKVWDGENFVSHGGAICKGVQNVITYQGLTATPGHLVHTLDGWRTFGDCAREQIPITQTGFGGDPIRLGEDHFARGIVARGEASPVRPCRMRMRDLWLSLGGVAQQFARWAHERVSHLQSAPASIPGMALCESAGAKGSLRQSEERDVSSLWRSRYRVSIFRRQGRDAVDHGEFGDSRGSQIQRFGQDQPGRALRAGEYSVAGAPIEPCKSIWGTGDGENALVSAAVSGSSLRGSHDEATHCRGAIVGRNLGEVGRSHHDQEEAEVWDILDAGPLNRFTCNGLLVHNCHSGNIERFAVDMFDVWDNGAGDLASGSKRDETPRKRDEATREKVVCGSCGGALRGNSCLCCGWEKPARSGIVAVEGEMVEFVADAMRMEARAGLRAECLKDPKAVYNAALCYAIEHCRDGDCDKSRKQAYAVWKGIYPNDKPPYGWFDMKPGIPDVNAYALADREVRRFRKNSKRRAA